MMPLAESETTPLLSLPFGGMALGIGNGKPAWRRIPRHPIVKWALFLFLLLYSPPHYAAEEAEQLYLTHCAQCHGPDRLGAIGPALLPQNLKRLRKKQAAKVIAKSRPAVQMPPFGDKLSAEQIQSLVKLIYTPLKEIPRWGMEEIRASQKILVPAATLPEKPIHSADPMNMFVVVELGDHHASILDGDKFEPNLRCKTRFALHGSPEYSPDGRGVYFTSRDGWFS